MAAFVHTQKASRISVEIKGKDHFTEDKRKRKCLKGRVTLGGVGGERPTFKIWKGDGRYWRKRSHEGITGGAHTEIPSK